MKSLILVLSLTVLMPLKAGAVQLFNDIPPCDSEYVTQGRYVTTVKPFDWSSLNGQSYSWYSNESLLDHVINGGEKITVPHTPLIVDGAPNPPFFPAVADIPQSFFSQTYVLFGSYSFYMPQTLFDWGVNPNAPGWEIEPPMTAEDLAVYDDFIGRNERYQALGVEYAALYDWFHSNGFFHADSNNIKCGIAAAPAGTTLILEPGTFYLGAYRQEDSSLVSSGRGQSFSYLTYIYPSFNRSLEYNPDYYHDYGGFGNGSAYPWPPVIIVDKPLTIMGRNAADSAAPTVITTPQGWSDLGNTLYTDAAWFVLASPDVTLRQLRFTDVIKGIDTIQAGTTIEDNVFEDSGYFNCLYIMDNASAFPNYPKLTPVRYSHLRRNTWNRVIAGPYIYGSGVIATDNELKLASNRHEDSFFGFFFGGGVPMSAEIPMEISMARANRIERNTIEGPSWWGALYVAGHLPEGVVSENTFANNQIHDMYAIVESYGFALFKDNLVTGNTIEGAPQGVVLYSRPNGRNPPEENRFAGNTYRDIWWAGVELGAGSENSFSGENFAESGLSGWSDDKGAFLLWEGTYDNRVSGVVLDPATNYCDQFLDFGANKIPGAQRCDDKDK